MLQRLYDWTIGLASHRRAMPALALLSAAESVIFPIPIDAMMLPMMFARPDRAITIAAVATITSVVGGVGGYLIGFYLFETVGQDIVALYGYESQFQAFQDAFSEWGWWIVIAGGFTPLPYKVITIASGVAALDPFVFVAASILSRGARFFLLGLLIHYFGPPIRGLIERNLAGATILLVALGIGGFVAVRYLI